MALIPTLEVDSSFDNAGGGQGTGPYTSSSFTPSQADSLLTVVVTAGGGGGTFSGSDLVLTDSLGHTWTKRVETVASYISGTLSGAMQMWTTEIDTPASMTLTLTHTGVNLYSTRLTGYTSTDYDTSVPIGATAQGHPASSAVSIAMSATPAVDSVVFGGGAVITANSDGSDGTIDPGSGWTELNEASQFLSFIKCQQQYRVAGDPCVWSMTTAVGSDFEERMGVAIEIRAPGGPPPGPGVETEFGMLLG